ncbi:MAG TPA: CocE/NonD family hydrolase C-terminal non-catalytic domain-containing protein [Rhizomicrobium sp.]|jgi:predicted acyl esterase|nr:CocE/NonD family hydrolase C-terminal non-catalytic domain-containing protein [Rhizomicrobium sp.]
MSKTVSASFAMLLALAGTMAPAYGAVLKRLYLASNGSATGADGDGTLRWGPWERDTSDKLPAASKSAVVYTTAPLDRQVQTTGNITVDFYAASDTRDVGLSATVEDVQPDGTVTVLSTKPLSASATPDKAAFYSLDLGDVSHAFLSGHRIRVEISTTAASANQRVLHSIARPSALVLRVEE